MESVDLHQIASMIDISAVRADVTLDELRDMAELARHYHFICAYSMPCFTHLLIDMLADCPDVHVGGVVGFPSGSETTAMKVYGAREMLRLGCTELDMVINIGALKSGYEKMVKDDIQAIVQTAGHVPVKAILEVAYLTRDEIALACEIVVSAGAQFIKTGTGWASKPTTREDVELIRSVVGDTARIKVAGGVRSLDMMLDMIAAGCCRFGIGYKSALSIMQEIDGRLGAVPFRALVHD